jgi:four helix bundle protein
MVRDFRDLRVWQQSMDLVVEIYEIARLLPPDERFELCKQLRRAAVSVPANIAEGNGRFHIGE